MNKDPIEGRIKKLLETERLFESMFNDCPVPCWHKVYDKRSDKFFMDIVNDAYTEATGITVEAYQGQSDPMLWEDSTAAIFHKNDSHVFRTRVVLPIEERINNPMTGTEQYAVGWKWPIVSGRSLTGIWGMANMFEKEMWEAARPTNPFYKKNAVILDKRWIELYGEPNAQK